MKEMISAIVVAAVVFGLAHNREHLRHWLFRMTYPPNIQTSNVMTPIASDALQASDENLPQTTEDCTMTNAVAITMDDKVSHLGQFSPL